MVGGEPRTPPRPLARDREEGLVRAHGYLPRGNRDRALLWLDRRAESARRPCALATALHTAVEAQSLVARQPRQGREAHRRRTHAPGGPGRDRTCPRRRPL